ncbi:MAG: hypothetical protein RLZZ401_726 [Pseudomonadota bacterium]|jgi:hypothetical protein
MKSSLIVLMALATAGCASIAYDTTQAVRIETVTADGQAYQGAECTFANDKLSGSGRSGRVAQINRSAQDLEVRCVVPDMPVARGRLMSRVNPGMFGNVMTGTMVGVAVDHLKDTGYSYPARVRLVFGQDRRYDQLDDVAGQASAGRAITEGAAPVGAWVSNGQPAMDLPARPAIALRQAPLVDGSQSAGSGFARLDDAAALPFVGGKAREAYQSWLFKPLPRAFAVSARGDWAAAWGVRPEDASLPVDPAQRALALCNRLSDVACKPYAVDGAVVWTP